MEGADEREDLLEWEDIYKRWNNSYWHGGQFNASLNVTAAPNTTWCGETSAPFESSAILIRAVGKAVILGLLILATIVGELILNIYLLVIKICCSRYKIIRY